LSRGFFVALRARIERAQSRPTERHHEPVMKRMLRAVKLLLRDGGLPRWLRGLAAVGVAPIPGPFDEAILLVVAAILWLEYRDRLRAAWRGAA
jgi:hypothetical protein